MKVIKVLFVSLMCLVNLVGCGSKDGLDKYRYSGQLIDLSYEVFDEKLTNDESFVFFITREGCHACEDFYTVVDSFLSENKDAVIYKMSETNIEAVDAFTVSAYFSEVLGTRYYEDHEYTSINLYTPSIAKVINGELVSANIGNMTKEELSYMYQDNYYSMDYFYSFNRKVQKKETFDVFVSLEGDENYDLLLREYFSTVDDKTGCYLNAKNFDESETERLLNRINYYLGDENSIENIPSYCLLQYEKGVLVNYVDSQFDVSSLDALYNK